ncbi:MAG: hypothetical protein WB947_06310 [Thermoplasmata archaeon]
MESGTPPPSPAARVPSRFTRGQKIGLGLLLTIVGLFLLSALLPTAPGKLGFALAVAAVGILSLWVGGILMGIGSRS